MATFDAETITKHWSYRTGFVWALIPLLVLEVGTLKDYPLALGIAALLSVTALEIVWRWSRALPRTKAGRLGFVVSIAYDDEEHAKRIRADFVRTLERLLKEGRTGPTFQLIEVSQFHAERVVAGDDAQRLRVQTRSHFVLYGRVRFRQVNGKDMHFVELDGIVAHQPLPQEVSKKLSQEFAELLPRRVTIAKEIDVFAFEFTSQWADMVARYVIGVASALSGDLDHAEQLFTNVLGKVQKSHRDFPVFSKLRQRLPKRLNELNEVRANIAYQHWASNHQSTALEKVGLHLSRLDSDYITPSVINLNAIYVFMTEKDVTAALAWLNKYEAPARDALWHLNVAFLLAYDNDLRTAIRHYRKAMAHRAIDADLIGKIEDFVYYIATSEPDKCQLFYCLGFFNWQFKGDTIQAGKDLTTFLEQRSPDRFVAEAKLAERWLQEMKHATGSSLNAVYPN